MTTSAIVNGRYFPMGAEIVEYCNGEVVVGLYETKEKPCAIAYKGKSKKPFAHYYFANAEIRAQKVADWVANYESDIARKEEAKKARKEATKRAGETVKVGDIFSASWGYEQTNVDYYQVVAKRGQTVDVREIGLKSAGGEGPMSDYVVPVKDYFISDEVITKRIQGAKWDGGVPYLAFDGFNNAYLDSGKPQYRSWYY